MQALGARPNHITIKPARKEVLNTASSTLHVANILPQLEQIESLLNRTRERLEDERGQIQAELISDNGSVIPLPENRQSIIFALDEHSVPNPQLHIKSYQIEFAEIVQIIAQMSGHTISVTATDTPDFQLTNLDIHGPAMTILNQLSEQFEMVITRDYSADTGHLALIGRDEFLS